MMGVGERIRGLALAAAMLDGVRPEVVEDVVVREMTASTLSGSFSFAFAMESERRAGR